jgi:mitochondrial cardiolipin hydrolase
MDSEVIFTRSASPAEAIERLVRSAMTSVVAALYRLNNPRLAAALKEARERGLSVRLVLNHNDHYEENQAAQTTLRDYNIPFRIARGRARDKSKMHHKFAVVDSWIALTGSYNWTLESEERNYENLLLLREPQLVTPFVREFEELWAEGQAPQSPGR